MMLTKESKIILVFLLMFLQIFAESELDFHFHQNDYHVRMERSEMVSYNKDYIETASLVSFKYNRTDVAVNLTLRFKIDVGSKLEFVVQLYKFASNEYRLFPLRLGDRFCKALDANVGGIKMLFARCGNFPHQCSYLKDKTYHACNMIVDESKFPPYIPNARYMAEVEVNYESINLFVSKMYFAVTRPEVKK